MKKLVLLLLLAITVTSVKAACVDWMVNANADLVGKTIYLLATAPGDYADESELAAAAVSQSTVVAITGGRGGATTYQASKTIAVNALVTPLADFYYAIVSDDGKSFNYLAADGIGAKVYDPDVLQESSKGTFDTISGADILAGTSKSFGGGDTPEPIPEPTSGLLLALGGAMLALRRRCT